MARSRRAWNKFTVQGLNGDDGSFLPQVTKANLDFFQTEMLTLLPRLRRMARVLAWEPADADDLTQLTVERALDALPEDQRIAVALVLIEGLSYQEAADSLEVPMGTLTSRLARGRATLQTVLTDQGVLP